MAYSVDKAIREQGKRIAAQQAGDDDGGAWLSSKAAQRMSLAEPENAHCRTLISKFGGTIRVGNAVSIPPQPWHNQAIKHYEDSYFGRHTPTHVVVNSAIPGYRGHRPHAPRDLHGHRTRPASMPSFAHVTPLISPLRGWCCTWQSGECTSGASIERPPSRPSLRGLEHSWL